MYNSSCPKNECCVHLDRKLQPCVPDVRILAAKFAVQMSATAPGRDAYIWNANLNLAFQPDVRILAVKFAFQMYAPQKLKVAYIWTEKCKMRTSGAKG